MFPNHHVNPRSNQIIWLLALQAIFYLYAKTSNQQFLNVLADQYRVNTKHLNKPFNKVTLSQPLFNQNGYYLATTTIDSLYSNQSNSELSGKQYRREYYDTYFNVTRQNNGSQSNTTQQRSLTTPSTLSYRMMETTTRNLKSEPSTVLPITVNEDSQLNIPPPTKNHMCKCVCNIDSNLESHDIQLEKLMNKINDSAAQQKRIDEILDSLIDEDENDYDDIEELEEIQKPNKYIPLEIIELAHRRPYKPHSNNVTTKSNITELSGTVNSTQKPLKISAPLYSFSFNKPMTTLKSIATRAVHYGIPMLLTVVLGNVLTQVELIDRAEVSNSPEVEESKMLPSWIASPSSTHQWSLFGVPITNQGYYSPFYETLSPQPLPSNFVTVVHPNVNQSNVKKQTKTTRKKPKERQVKYISKTIASWWKNRFKRRFHWFT